MLKDITKQVNLLTLPTRHDMWINRETGGLTLHTTWDDPLLEQLKESIYSGQGGYGRGGSEKRARAVMDYAALEQFGQIRREVHEMTLDLLGPRYYGLPAGDPAPALRRWLRLYSAHVTRAYTPVAEPKRQQRVLLRLSGWSTMIIDKFDPPRQLEIMAECPRCHARYAEDEMGDRVSALVAQIREGLPKTARCRACKWQWTEKDIPMLVGSVNE